MNETHPRSYAFFFISFFFPSLLPLPFFRVRLRLHLSPLLFFLFFNFLSIGRPILTFCTSTEIAVGLPTDRVSRIRGIPRGSEVAAATGGRSSAAIRAGRRSAGTCVRVPLRTWRYASGPRNIQKSRVNERRILNDIPTIFVSPVALCLQNDHERRFEHIIDISLKKINI